jgi:hypothetical protein
MMDDPGKLIGNTPMQLKLSAFAPWGDGSTPAQVSVTVPGLSVTPEHVALPATVAVSAPPDAERGLYYVQVTGDCLRLKRWFEYQAQ